jgi:hypothetical protein
MTNQETPQAHQSYQCSGSEYTTAELRDADGQVISIGEAIVRPSDMIVLFYPLDRAEEGSILQHTRHLFLTKEAISYSVCHGLRCPTPHDRRHYHFERS